MGIMDGVGKVIGPIKKAKLAEPMDTLVYMDTYKRTARISLFGHGRDAEEVVTRAKRELERTLLMEVRGEMMIRFPELPTEDLLIGEVAFEERNSQNIDRELFPVEVRIFHPMNQEIEGKVHVFRKRRIDTVVVRAD